MASSHRWRAGSRKPLAEMSLSAVLSASNTGSTNSSNGAAPILKPLSASHKASRANKRSQGVFQASPRDSCPQTPPHHETTPKNIRPHHPHVSHSQDVIPSTSQIVQNSPTTAVARPRTPPQSPLPGSSSPKSAGLSSKTSQALSHPRSLARKKERVDDVLESQMAKERVQRPINASPSPHKAASPSTLRSARRSSLLSSRSPPPKVLAHANASRHALPETYSSSEDDDIVAVKPLLMPVASPLRSTNDSPLDLFGASVMSTSGGLMILQDAEAQGATTSISPQSSADSDALGDEWDKENMQHGLHAYLAQKLPSAKSLQTSWDSDSDSGPMDGTSSSQSLRSLGTATTCSSTGSLSQTNNANVQRQAEPNIPDATSLLSSSSSSPQPSASSSPRQEPPAKRKKGTGGRLSLLATADGSYHEEDDDSIDRENA
ncbi:unnamed protein product [Jaminaea pallidilutea]